MEIAFVEKDGKVTPAYASDAAAWAKVKRSIIEDKVPHVFTVVKDRNLRHHRKYWAILHTARENSEALQKDYGTEEALHAALKWEFCRLNPEHFVTISAMDGDVLKEVKTVFSESPERMTQAAFEQFYSFAVQTLADTLGCTPGELEGNSDESGAV